MGAAYAEPLSGRLREVGVDVESIGSCYRCKASLYASDVVRTLPIPKAPHHVALVWSCPYCAEAGRFAAERAAWQALKQAASSEEDRLRKIMIAAQIELDAVDTVDDVVAVFNSYGPPMMEVPPHRGCGCKSCASRRFYGTKG